MRSSVQHLLALAAAVTLSGCFATFPEDHAVTAAPGTAVRALEVFYVTNRAPIAGDDGTATYGHDRSHSLAFGSIAVSGHDAEGAIAAPPNELGRFPATPYAMERTPGGVRRASDTVAAHERSVADMQGEIQRRLAATSRKEIVVFVHGYNNSFEDAAKSAAQICNDLGPQEFVCIALTWPAGGSKGILFGYNVDRESGEFAVTDIRKAIRIIAGTPGLRQLHFLAHSRGTDVLTSALQHLAIEAYVSQGTLATKFKVSNIILAAPDIDIDVAFARLFGLPSDPDLPYGRSPQRRAILNPGKLHFTIYSSTGDRALSLSKTLFGSQLRLGLLDAQSDPSEMQIAPDVAGLVDFISVQGGGGLIGHSYFLSDPAVRADLVTLIRDEKPAGDASRQLVEVKRPFWYLPDKPQVTH
jgi:esterase/lipase superfamily enzyme